MKKILVFIITSSLFLTTLYCQVIVTVAGNGGTGYSGNGGPATAAEFWEPQGVAVDASGNLYIGDYIDCVVRIVNTSGIISNFAGNHTNGFSGDGGPATAAELGTVVGIYIDASGNTLIADANNDRIRMVNTSGIITTIAGNGTPGYSGNGGPASAAELSQPYDIIKDNTGNLYICDHNNHCIREVNTLGIIATIAGNGTYGYNGDGGPATAAQLYYPEGITLDKSGNLIIADFYNSRVRMVNSSGIISTIAGTGAGASTGDGGPATAAGVFGPAKPIVDTAGNIYVSEFSDNEIRKINTSGIISTIAGVSTYGYYGDGGYATAAELFQPFGICLDATGNIYIADMNNRRVREICGCPLAVQEQVNSVNECAIYPNPTDDNFTVKLSKTGKTVVTLYDITGREMLNTVKENTSAFNISVTEMPAGIYLLKLQSDDGTILTRKIEVVR